MSASSSKAAVAAAVVVIAVAGCGGSSKKSSSTSSSGSSTGSVTSSSTGTTSTNGAHPLSKAAYEAKLGPLFNNGVDPALRSVLANGGAKNPRSLRTAARLIREARDAMASLTPPSRVADLNQQAVTTLGALADDLSKMSDSLDAHNRGSYVNAAKAAVHDALKIESIGHQFTARGF